MQEHLWERAVRVEVRPIQIPPPDCIETGDIYATAGALALDRDGICDVSILLGRHLAGDWGDIPEEDKLENAAAVEQGWRVISEYQVNRQGDRVLVVTEADRSGTTFLTAEEYHKGRRNGKARQH